MNRIYTIYLDATHLARTFLLSVLSLLLLSLAGVSADAQEPAWPYALPAMVKTGFDKGDQAAVSSFFGQSVELRLPGTSGIFSRKQAEMILGEFFASHKGMVFMIDHEETVSGSTLTIGNVNFGGQKLRVYILSQNAGSDYTIKQFRIEELRSAD